MLSLRFIDFYIGVSKNYKDMLIERNFNPERIYTVYNGIDFKNADYSPISRQAFCEKYGIAAGENDVIIGILARLDPVKDHKTFLEAARLVLDKNPSVIFLIGGDGNRERKTLESRTAELGLTKNVYFLGHVDTYDFLNCIDINVLASISESFPYVLLEGALFRKATVSTDVGGIPDLIDDGKNGFLFEPRDIKKLADSLLKLTKNSNLRKEMGEKLRQKAENNFSLQSMSYNQFNIYKNILENVGKPQYDAIISGYYGHENSGDDAILSAMVDNLRAYKKDIRIVVFSRNPMETRKINSVFSINRFNIFGIIKAMKKSQLFINGGGSLIQDISSTRSLMYYLGTIWLAKRLGLKVMVYANGIGPVNKKLNRLAVKKILNNVDIITLREDSSRVELEKLQITSPKIIVTADPALNIKPVRDNVISKVFANENIDSSGPYIGFSIREWQGSEKYTSVIARTADYLIEKYDMKPIFIPMHYPDDLEILRVTVSKMKNKGYIIKNKYTASYMLGIIKRLDLMVGMRLHSLIYASTLSVPLIGLVYEPKVESFIQYIDQTSAGNVENLEYENLIELIENIITNKDTAKAHLKTVIAPLKLKALENARIAVELMEGKE